MKIHHSTPPPIIEESLSFPSLVSSTHVVEGNEVCSLVPLGDQTSHLSYKDFSLQSLIDANATDLLRPCASLSPSRLDSADSVEMAVESLTPQYEPKKDTE